MNRRFALRTGTNYSPGPPITLPTASSPFAAKKLPPLTKETTIPVSIVGGRPKFNF